MTTNRRVRIRRAIGWIAAYALALQAILGSIAPHLAIPFDPAVPFDLAAICLNSHGGGVESTGDNTDNQNTGSQAGDHCALCASSPPPLVGPPQHGSVVAIYVTASEVIVPPPLAPPFSKVASRPGGARAPPTIA